MTTSKQSPPGLVRGRHLFQIKTHTGFYTAAKNRIQWKTEEYSSSLSISKNNEESLMLTAKKWQLERDASELARIQLQIKQVQKANGKHKQQLLALSIE